MLPLPVLVIVLLLLARQALDGSEAEHADERAGTGEFAERTHDILPDVDGDRCLALRIEPVDHRFLWQHVDHVDAADPLRIVDIGIRMAFCLELRDALARDFLDFLIRCELQGICRAGLGARRRYALFDAVEAEVALRRLMRLWVDLRDVERAVGHAVAAADALLFIDDDCARSQLVDGFFRAALRAGWVAAVHALRLDEVPVEFPLVIRALSHADERPRRRGQRRMRLILSLKRCRQVSRQVMPLLAGDHAGSAGAAACDVVQHCHFLCLFLFLHFVHLIHFLSLLTLLYNILFHLV